MKSKNIVLFMAGIYCLMSLVVDKGDWGTFDIITTMFLCTYFILRDKGKGVTTNET